MSNELLFDVPVQLSPRAAWIKRHALSTQEVNPEAGTGANRGEDEFGNEVFRWTAHRPHELFSRRGLGDTEDDAITDRARKNGVRLWNEVGL